MPPARGACSGAEDPQGGGGGEDEQLRGAQQYLKPSYQVLRVVAKY